MKKIFLTAAILLGGLTSYATSDFITNPNGEDDGVVMEAEKVYKQIKISDVPQAVLEALATDFNTATLNKAYINAKEEYKLVIMVQEVTSAVHREKVYADKFGNWIVKSKDLIPVSNRLEEISKQY